MKCTQEGCEGQLMVGSSRMSIRTGYWTRNRVCDKCGYKIKTMEVSEEEFNNEMKLLEDMEKAFERYTFNKEKAAKSDDVDKDVA